MGQKAEFHWDRNGEGKETEESLSVRKLVRPSLPPRLLEGALTLLHSCKDDLLAVHLQQSPESPARAERLLSLVRLGARFCCTPTPPSAGRLPPQAVCVSASHLRP